MLCEYRGGTKNSPPALIPVQTSQQLILHHLCMNSLKSSRLLGTERYHWLQALNFKAMAKLPALEAKQIPLSPEKPRLLGDDNG